VHRLVQETEEYEVTRKDDIEVVYVWSTDGTYEAIDDPMIDENEYSADEEDLELVIDTSTIWKDK
jgi:hypothetical protein